MRRMLKRTGVLAYSVVARRIAPTLRRKSTAKAMGVYGLKKFCRDCRADQRTTAAFQSLADSQTSREEAYWSYSCNIVDLRDLSSCEIRNKVFFKSFVARFDSLLSCSRHGELMLRDGALPIENRSRVVSLKMPEVANVRVRKASSAPPEFFSSSTSSMSPSSHNIRKDFESFHSALGVHLACPDIRPTRCARAVQHYLNVGSPFCRPQPSLSFQSTMDFICTLFYCSILRACESRVRRLKSSNSYSQFRA